LPESTFWPMVGSCESTSAPKNQNQEIPNTLSQTDLVLRAICRLLQVERIGFQSNLRSACTAGDFGIARLLASPASAMAMNIALRMKGEVVSDRSTPA